MSSRQKDTPGSRRDQGRGPFQKDSSQKDPSQKDPYQRDPWRAAPVIVAQIPEAGLHREIEADAAARQAMAEIGGLREVVSARAAFDLTLGSDGRVHVTGRVTARVGQDCVVTLDPVENEIDEPVDLIFAPSEQIPQLADLVDDDLDDDAEVPDPPEPIVNGQIELGRIATDALFLGIDPYPRKEGAVFEAGVEADDPEAHPFAALKALQPQVSKKDGKG
jgi:uncharacterized metal-binding protein YceD (DUF177 family)